MKCKACGKEFDEKSVFCPECGERGIAPDPGPASDDPPAGKTNAPAESDKDRDEKEMTMSERFKAIGDGETKPAAEGDGAQPSDGPCLPWSEGGYCGKAMRGHFVLALLFTVPFVALGVWLVVSQRMPDGVWSQVIWGGLLLLPALLWIYLWCIYIYRTWTIKYRLTEFRFFHEKGLFRRERDVIEVVDIDDLRYEQTLLDRFINGGVGTVVIHSSDPSDPELRLIGLDRPDCVFEAIDEVRRTQRTKLGLKAI